MFDSMRIRTKLAVALLIPLVALVALSSAAIAAATARAETERAKAAKIAEQIDLASASIGPAGVVKAVQNEQSSEAINMIGYGQAMNAGDPAAIRRTDDTAIAEFTATIATKPASVQDAYKDAIAAIERIPDIRRKADDYRGPRDLSAQELSAALYDDYSAVVEDVFAVNKRATQAIDDLDLRRGAQFIDNLASYQSAQTKTLRLVSTGAATGPLVQDPALFASAARADEQTRSYKEQLLNTGSQFYTDVAHIWIDDPTSVRLEGIATIALNGGETSIADILSNQSLDAETGFDRAIAAASKQLRSDADALKTRSQQDADAATAQARSLTLVTGLVLVVAVGVIIVASRSITKPLHRLTVDAERMATAGLPATVQSILDTPPGDDVALPELEEIDRSGGYEIAEVASALNTVQASAADLAVEQAVLRRNIADSFVNLGRRNQNLLSRQLDSITEMERNESDPDALRSLFTLDHLATRMRRNAESLLLLAGLEPHRQWSEPIALEDILRGALGEVEHYQRVSIRSLDPATVEGKAAADLTHLIAELLENALRYSPDTVEIVARHTDDGYTLAIVDHGIGMDDDEIAQANIRLAGAESFTVAPSKYLGHYVVGRQAERLNVKVHLEASTGGGVTAFVELGAVITGDEPSSELNEPELNATALVPERFQRDARGRAGATTAPSGSVGGGDEVPATVGASAARSTAPDTVRGPRANTATAVERTASGYVKRVRGANTPSTDVASTRATGEAPKSSFGGATGMRNALSGLQAGLQRGHEQAKHNDDAEEGR